MTLNDHRDTIGLSGMLDGTCAPYLLEMGTLSEKKKMFGNGRRLRIVTGQKKNLSLKPDHSELCLLQGVTDDCFLVLHV